jgi:hypothetical protein
LPSIDPLTAFPHGSTVADLLRNQGRPQAEIDLLLRMPQQLSNVGLTNLYIIFGGFQYGHDWNMGGHYYLVGHDDGQTSQNCGLFATIRLLYVLGQNGVVPRHWWYSLTVQQMRDILVDRVVIGGVPVEKYYRDQGMPLEAVEIKALMQYLGIPTQYIRIVKQGPYWVDKAERGVLEAKAAIELFDDLKKVQNGECLIETVVGKNNKGEYNRTGKEGKKVFDQNDIDKKIQDFINNYNMLTHYMIGQREDAEKTLEELQNALKTGDFSCLNDWYTSVKASS